MEDVMAVDFNAASLKRCSRSSDRSSGRQLVSREKVKNFVSVRQSTRA